MARLVMAGLAVVLGATPSLVFAQSNTAVGAPPIPTHPVVVPTVSSEQSLPSDDRWCDVPGGASAYRRPDYGFTLPRYWVAARFYIANYRAYDLPRPAAGFGWSRYYDDVVLTDRWGRVYDSRAAFDANARVGGGWPQPDRQNRTHRVAGRYSEDTRIDREGRSHWDSGRVYGAGSPAPVAVVETVATTKSGCKSARTIS